MNNPANEIVKEARKQKKSYWELMSDKGFVADAIHTELDELEAYKKKCEDRRKER